MTPTAAAIPAQDATVRPSRAMKWISSYGIVLLVTAVVIFPVFWWLVSSLKKSEELFSTPIRIFPAVPQWSNFFDALTMIPYARFAGNSLFLALSFTILTIVTSSMGGFAFARLQAPGRSKLFGVVLALLIIPGIVTVIPQFVVFARLGLANTYWPWILWGLAASPFFIFMFRQFFTTIPKELEEAAELDGCGLFRMFWQIFLPNSKPALATAFILSFVGVWGDYITPLIFLGDQNTTLAVKLTKAYVTPQGQTLIPVTLAAGILFTIVPLIMFLVGQRNILKGAVTSGLK